MTLIAKLVIAALGGMTLQACTASQVLNSAVSVTGTLGSIGQSPTPTGPFKFDNSPPDLSLTARIERGQALPKYEGPSASAEWLKLNCTGTYEPGRRSAVSRDQCIQQLAAALPPFDPNKPRHFGERYSPKTWLDCRINAHDFGGAQGYSPAACDKYKLRRIENPTFWPYEHNKDFKWPEAPKETVYRSGMTPAEYHKALCEKESGQWVYKRVEGVKSIYLVRPYRTTLNQDYQRDLLVEEGTYLVSGYSAIRAENLSSRFPFVEAMFEKRRPLGEQAEESGSVFAGSSLYPGEPDPFDPRIENYFLGALTNTRRAEDGSTRKPKNPLKPYFVNAIPQISSSIGIVWRDVERLRDRELAVGGLEVAIVDLRNNEVLGLYRTFVNVGRGWETARRCATPTKTGSTLHDFITSSITF